MAAVPETVDAYIAAQPVARHESLLELRRTFLAAVPDATEAIRYGMPAYRLPNGHPVYFAGWKQHVSLHDIPVLDATLESELAPFRSGKDTLKFPHRQPLPFELISRTIAAIATRPA